MDWDQLWEIVSLPDNIPIVFLLVLLPFFLWYGLRQAFANDRLISRLEVDSELAKKHHRKIEPISGYGLWYNIQFKDADTGSPAIKLADAIAMECVRRGVMSFITGRGYLKIAPPLSIDVDALREAIEVVGMVIDELIDQ